MRTTVLSQVVSGRAHILCISSMCLAVRYLCLCGHYSGTATFRCCNHFEMTRTRPTTPALRTSSNIMNTRSWMTSASSGAGVTTYSDAGTTDSHFPRMDILIRSCSSFRETKRDKDRYWNKRWCDGCKERWKAARVKLLNEYGRI